MTPTPPGRGTASRSGRRATTSAARPGGAPGPGAHTGTARTRSTRTRTTRTAEETYP
ncbi:hypothetical protein ACWGDE_17880 [Streptomyces sp. NPDC054956]